MSANAFYPQGDSAAIDCTDVSSTPVQVRGLVNNATARLFTNIGDKTCFVCCTKTAAEAIATVPVDGTPGNGVPIAAGAIMALSFPPDWFFAAICASGETTTLYITPGEGN